jgi:acetyl esterase/lipase
VTEQLPPDVIAQLTALGPEITPELGQASWALLKPFHDKVGYTAPAIDRDRTYGEHERHRLDVHTSGEPAGELAPVVLFAHGGGFIGGDKHVPGAPMYDHIGAWAVRNGWVGVTMTATSAARSRPCTTATPRRPPPPRSAACSTPRSH